MDTGLEHKFCRPESGLTVTDGTRIEGYASLFGMPDQGGDVVEPGAYGASLARLAASGGRVKMLWQHDPTRPIGVWDEVREDGRGLWVKGRILTEVETGREAAALLSAGAMDGLSIGYRTLRATKGAEGHRRLVELDLWEVSLVTFPMLRDARVGTKGGEPDEELSGQVAAAFEAAAQMLAEARDESSKGNGR